MAIVVFFGDLCGTAGFSGCAITPACKLLAKCADQNSEKQGGFCINLSEAYMPGQYETIVMQVIPLPEQVFRNTPKAAPLPTQGRVHN